MPDGHPQEPGGWNRVVLQVADLPSRIEILKKSGLHFRNQMETGPGVSKSYCKIPMATRSSYSSLPNRT